MVSRQEYHALVAKQMKEDGLDVAVRAILDSLGLGLWRFHMPDGVGGVMPGFPDLVIIGPGGVLWRELKTERGRLSPHQRAVGERLVALGHDYGVWRPSDLLSGRIRLECEAVAGPPSVRAAERLRHAQYKSDIRRRGGGRRFRRAA